MNERMREQLLTVWPQLLTALATTVTLDKEQWAALSEQTGLSEGHLRRHLDEVQDYVEQVAPRTNLTCPKCGSDCWGTVDAADWHEPRNPALAGQLAKCDDCGADLMLQFQALCLTEESED
ncbi:hypothetical protein [Ferrimonas marina]|uniref:Uncharacterized protein n=1 Tax=Ferrimonas marina TaxID=299255 RepID=A0A1M5U861_9GAMM|nr:hypothetical protein [Ferrimonas marina]SHH59232.1 hypothetical protein SAMN02745129_2451 [Ferrimonas marina]